jgi:Skp family chaperone for outer membrane proteins
MTNGLFSTVRKQITLLTLAVVVMVGLAVPSWAADTIGVVDFNKVLSAYEQFQTYQADDKVKQAELNKLKADILKQLEDSRKKNAATPIQTENLEKQLSTQFRTRFTEYQTWATNKGKEIETQVNSTIKNTAQKQGVSIVLDRGQVLTGGIDITNEVITGLNTVRTPATK